MNSVHLVHARHLSASTKTLDEVRLLSRVALDDSFNGDSTGSVRLWEARRRLLGDEDLRTLRARQDLGHVLHELGDNQAAREHLEAVLEARIRLQGEDHPAVHGTMFVLSRTLSDLGDKVGYAAMLVALMKHPLESL